MSALRLGRLPDGTRHVVILEPAVGRVSFARYGIRNGGPPVIGSMAVGESAKTVEERTRREWNARREAEAQVMTNPDNGAVRASTTEVQP